jgi:hypothetical protein
MFSRRGPPGPGEPGGQAGESARRGQSEYQGEDRGVRCVNAAPRPRFRPLRHLENIF